MKTPYYNTEISQKIKDDYKPYGISRREADSIVGDFVFGVLVREVRKAGERNEIEKRNKKVKSIESLCK
ncbi:MAG: hypothetical protein KatS3mg001_137 [Candidatus Pacearchaeota archaeon]|nr:MAG: hypothetical protein KatS3mg001_137 [Candidatus Pacearchaeota archaeon]